MTKLSVNINKVATLRNARGGNNPNLLKVAEDIVKFGAQGVTIHPRPDERHIKIQDVYELSNLLKAINSNRKEIIEFNIEGYPSDDFMKLIEDVKPHQCTLVPDPPNVITSNAGWKCDENKKFLTQIVNTLRNQNVRSSLFVDPHVLTQNELTALKEIQPDRCELYTESYARNFNGPECEEVTRVYKAAAEKLNAINIELNAGHDLDQNNLNFLIARIPEIKEVSIGHALICESLYDGLQATIKNYLKELQA